MPVCKVLLKGTKKIHLRTNIDAYSYMISPFPENLLFPPKENDFVYVRKQMESYYRNKNLPVRLEVCNVSHTDNSIICELHYNKTDYELAVLAGAKPWG